VSGSGSQLGQYTGASILSASFCQPAFHAGGQVGPAAASVVVDPVPDGFAVAESSPLQAATESETTMRVRASETAPGNARFTNA
jgi:hypothetical protein